MQGARGLCNKLKFQPVVNSSKYGAQIEPYKQIQGGLCFCVLPFDPVNFLSLSAARLTAALSAVQ